MFKAGVKPEWEDPVNQNGSEFRIEVKMYNNNDTIQQIWQKVVIDMVLGEFPHISDGIAGVRINQRHKNFSFINFRLEIWMTVEKEDCDIVRNIKKYLEEYIIDDLLKDQQGATCKFDSREGFRADLRAKAEKNK